jgi:hypothetical protein
MFQSAAAATSQQVVFLPFHRMSLEKSYSPQDLRHSATTHPATRAERP